MTLYIDGVMFIYNESCRVYTIIGESPPLSNQSRIEINTNFYVASVITFNIFSESLLNPTLSSYVTG